MAGSPTDPPALDPIWDLPHSPPRASTDWLTENYLFLGYDPVKRIGFYHHIGRLIQCPAIWRGTFSVALPDGRLLMSKTYGHDHTPRGPSTGDLGFECVELLRRWRIVYGGVAQLTTCDANRREFLHPLCPTAEVEFDVSWDAVAPAWYMGGGVTDRLDWCDGHLEQHGFFRGHLRYSGGEIAISGTGYRDHSVGPRDLRHWQYGTWLNAQFRESGRAFAVLVSQDGRKEGATELATVAMGGELHDVNVIEAPTWQSGTHFAEREIGVVLSSPTHLAKVRGEILDEQFYRTVSHPWDLHDGMTVDAARDGSLLWTSFETSVRYEWDGEVGHGWLSASRRKENHESQSGI